MTDSPVINAETGLPELPEGYFWEVAKAYQMGGALELRVVRTIKVPALVRKTRKVYKARNLFFPSHEAYADESYDIQDKILSAYPLYEELEMEDCSDDVRDSLTNDGWKVSLRWGRANIDFFREFEASKEVLRKTALDVFPKALKDIAEVESQEQASKLREELIGQYPPKSAL